MQMTLAAPDYATGLSGARVLITGGSGFIGTNLVAAYRQAGIPVTNLDVAPPRDQTARDKWVRIDLTHGEHVRRVFGSFRPTHVFHLAARTDLDGRRVSDYGANTIGVTNVLSAAAQAEEPIKRLVVASSRMVCRIGYQPLSDADYCPTTAYGASKVETERLVRAATRLPWILARPTSIWGPWFDVPYRDFFLSVARGRYVQPMGHRIHKSFGFVGNTTWQLHRLMTSPARAVLQQTFYLADDPPIEVGDFADRISVAVGRRPPRSAPLPILKALARVGDAARRVGMPAPLTSFRLANLLTPMVHDIEPLLRIAGPPPFDETAGVTATVRWMRTEGLLNATP